MFDDTHVNGGISVQKIMECQDSVFEHYLDTTPNETERYYSPFRSDSTPGCRFDYDEGIWKFVDNATYRGKLKFNCIELVMYMFDTSYQEAINKIGEEVELVNNYNEPPQLFIPDIRIIPKKLDGNNYFTREYDLSVNYLKSQGVYGVKRYWCNTRKHNYLKLNAYANPTKVETFCYKINDRKELYFPGQKVKFVKNTSGKDLYGFPTSDEYVVLTEGKKDQMVLHYHYGISTQGLQNVYHRPEINEPTIILLLDPDEKGIEASKRLVQFYEEQSKHVVNLTRQDNLMDVADLYKHNKQKLNSIIDEIISFS